MLFSWKMQELGQVNPRPYTPLFPKSQDKAGIGIPTPFSPKVPGAWRASPRFSS